MDELFEAVREACERAVWSRGVELVRQGAVHGAVELATREVVMRVEGRAGRATPAVRLLPARSGLGVRLRRPDDPCEHVAAAVIAWRRAREAGEALPRGRGRERAARLSPVAHARRASRSRACCVRDGRDEPLPASLAAYAAGQRERRRAARERRRSRGRAAARSRAARARRRAVDAAPARGAGRLRRRHARRRAGQRLARAGAADRAASKTAATASRSRSRPIRATTRASRTASRAAATCCGRSAIRT